MVLVLFYILVATSSAIGKEESLFISLVVMKKQFFCVQQYSVVSLHVISHLCALCISSLTYLLLHVYGPCAVLYTCSNIFCNWKGRLFVHQPSGDEEAIFLRTAVFSGKFACDITPLCSLYKQPYLPIITCIWSLCCSIYL